MVWIQAPIHKGGRAGGEFAAACHDDRRLAHKIVDVVTQVHILPPYRGRCDKFPWVFKKHPVKICPLPGAGKDRYYATGFFPFPYEWSVKGMGLSR